MEFSVLGPLAVSDDGRPVEVPGTRRRALLIRLLVDAGRVLPSDRLAEDLWEGEPPRTAVGTLQNHISYLRGVLGRQRVERSGPGYMLILGEDELDSNRFARELASARAALAADRRQAAAAEVDTALARWRGLALADVRDAAWAQPEVARLEQLHGQAIECSIESLLGLERFPEAIARAETAIVESPLREALWQLLITALYRSGRQADALRAYQRLRETLRDEVGIEPSQPLRELEARVLAQDPNLLRQPLPVEGVVDGASGASGVITFLLTDIEGSAQLWESDSEKMAAAVSRHDALVTDAIVAHRGRVAKTRGENDGIFATFVVATDAVAAALTAQLSLSAEQWPADVAVTLRVAVHSGEAVQREGDFFGPAVNRTARLRELAHGGQVLVSQAACELARDGLPAGAELADLGEHRLRDLHRPERVFQLVHPSLPAVTSPLRGLDLALNNLPTQATNFVGRQRSLDEVERALGGARIVTLTGVGGVGKTRLALHVAARLVPQYPDGTWLVELAPTFDAATVVDVVAGTLGVTPRQGATLENSLYDYLRAKRLLLVLDNCEHLLDAVARFTHRVVRECPGVDLIATSREGLAVDGERILVVPSLELPDDDGDATLAEAVELFAARATAARADFRLTGDNAAEVARLCRRLDGIPLAIELAAARIRSLSPAELADRVDERFRLLAGGVRTAVERHQTLRRAIDWSYELLTESEQQTLNRVAVFGGSFGLAGAEAVVADADIDATEVVDLLARLVDKSLVVADPARNETRYRLLETIRSYAQDSLHDAGEARAVRARHCAYYCEFAAIAGAALRGREEAEWTERVKLELDNLRAATAWSLSQGETEAVLRLLTPFAIPQTRTSVFINAWLEQALALEGAADCDLYPEIFAWSAWTTAISGDPDRGVRLGHAALRLASSRQVPLASRCRILGSVAGAEVLASDVAQQEVHSKEWVAGARALGDDFELALALTSYGSARMLSGDLPVAEERLAEALLVARRLGNPTSIALAALVMGTTIFNSDPDAASALFEEGLVAASKVDSVTTANLLSGRAALYLLQGNWEEGAHILVAALDHLNRAGDSLMLRFQLVDVVVLLAGAGEDETAAVVDGAAREHMRSYTAWLTSHAEVQEQLAARLGRDRFAACRARGAAMDDAAVIAFLRERLGAMAERPGEPPGSPGP